MSKCFVLLCDSINNSNSSGKTSVIAVSDDKAKIEGLLKKKEDEEGILSKAVNELLDTFEYFRSSIYNKGLNGKWFDISNKAFSYCLDKVLAKFNIDKSKFPTFINLSGYFRSYRYYIEEVDFI